MRLIDADKLKEEFYNRKRTPDDMKYMRVPVEVVYQFIDNAPTVEYPFYQEAYQTGYEEGMNDRPKGKWLKSGKGKTTFFCSECGREIDTKPFTRPDNFPFCHCGADMRGGVKNAKSS